MKSLKQENRAFWIFLIWILVLPFIHHPGISAQSEKDEAAQEEVLPDEAPEKNDADSEEVQGDEADPAPKAGEEADEEEEEPEKVDEALPALSANPEELAIEVNGIFRAKKFKDVFKKLSKHEDAVETSKDLLAMYVESIVQSDKPDYRKMDRYAGILLRKDSKSSLGNYAKAVSALNAKKPNLKKALSYISKAKSAKKPYPDAAATYYMILLKSYWQILIAIVLLPIVAIVKVIQKKKAAAKPTVEINLDVPVEESSSESPESDVVEESSANLDVATEAVPSSDPVSAQSEQTEPSVKPAVEPTPSVPVTEPEPAVNAQPAEPSTPAPAPEITGGSVAVEANPEPVNPYFPQYSNAPEGNAPATPVQNDTPAPVIEKNEPVNPYFPQYGNAASAGPVAAPAQNAKEPESPLPVSTPVAPEPPASDYRHPSLQAKHSASVQNLAEPSRRAPVSDDHELDAIWNKLCQKALDKRIPRQVRDAAEQRSAYRPGLGGSPRTSYSGAEVGDPIEPQIDFNVTIDLSEDSLKDDLIGKLKMLAISDGELRSLLAQKNPAHIPHFIEYVLTKPEPVRLSLVARELGHFTDPAVIDTLASLLYNEDQRVALAAIQGLENSKSPMAILHICPFLKSDIPILAQAARSALSNFGAVKILKAFLKLPAHPDERIRESGVFVLSRMKGAQVEELLLQMLHDESPLIRQKVLLAMSYQKNANYLPDLREFFRTAEGEDKTLVRKAIVYLQGFSRKS